jgi:ABC-2 type transport system ATP-binding protein
MIKIQNLVKAYNKEVVLNIPELTIERGQIFGLVGNNGAEKRHCSTWFLT